MMKSNSLWATQNHRSQTVQVHGERRRDLESFLFVHYKPQQHPSGQIFIKIKSACKIWHKHHKHVSLFVSIRWNALCMCVHSSSNDTAANYYTAHPCRTVPSNPSHLFNLLDSRKTLQWPQSLKTLPVSLAPSLPPSFPACLSLSHCNSPSLQECCCF